VTWYRWRVLWAGALIALTGFAVLLAGLVEVGALQFLAADVLGVTLGWGPFAEAIGGLVTTTRFHSMVAVLSATLGKSHVAPDAAWLRVWFGLGVWMVGWGLVAAGIQRKEVAAEEPSEAVGAPLFPRLARYQDFHWGTLAAYGFGILFAELALISSYLMLVGQNQALGTVTTAPQGLSPVLAFVISLGVGMAVAFVGGFIGSANSKRLSTPEATIAILYFGLPVPAVLSAMHTIPSLMLSIGYRLREIVYLASLLGDARPELSYWLVFVGLVLALFLGLNFGFVATSSGRLDLRTNYELFVASRHVQVFRPRLLLGAFAVLILGIVPPLILYAIVMAAQGQIERTRMRRLGLKDPLKAAEALNALKLKAQTPTAMMTALSVGGVGVGVMALIIVLSVMSGFELDLQQKILGTNSHGVVLKYADSMPEYPEVMDKIRTLKGVAGQTPFILNEVMISSEGNISGSMIKGIDPDTIGTVTDLPKYMLPGGKLEWLNEPSKIARKRLAPMGGPVLDDRPAGSEGGAKLERDPLIDEPKADGEKVMPGIILGKELASSLKVVVGDRINVVSPLGGELGPQGPMPKSRPFRVAGIFYSGMFEYDSKFVYVHLKEAQSFFGLKGATGIELKFDDVDDARRLTKAIYDKLEGYPYRTRDWGDMNKNLFAALRLEKLVMGIILSIIVIVAAGLIVATVIMLVLEKRKEIAVLKALGVPDGGIVKIFLTEGLQIGVAGGVLGLFAGLAWCLFIEKVGIKLDPSVYYIPALPVKIEPFQTALSVVIAILVTFLASIYPALKASQVEPVDGLKAE
jgi:lipoprotein-releasing system permease protein